ncbi:MAG: DUF4349 domain-containing protein [Chloroflexota bacterium]
MKRLGTGLGLILLLMSVGCGLAGGPPEEAPAVLAPAPPVPPSEFSRDAGEGASPAAEQRVILRSAKMALLVADVLDTRNKIANLTQTLGGYVVSSRVAGEEGDVSGSISIRVPEAKLEQALSELRSLAVRVQSESTSARDVTEQYVDLKSRLKNAEATEGQYVALLEKANNADEILKIYEKLTQVRRDIEQIKGRMQYLEQTAAMSLIETELATASSRSGLVFAGWDALGVLKSALRSLVGAFQLLASLAIIVLVFVPIWGPIVAIVYWLRKRKAKTQGTR